MPLWTESSQLGPRQTTQPLLWMSDWPEEDYPLPIVTDEDLLALHGPGRASRVLTYGHQGSKRDGRLPHFITTRSGYKMHTDPGFVRFTHQVVLRNDGFQVRGLAVIGDPREQRRGSMYCLDTFSPHCIVRDPRWNDGIYKLQAVVDADEPLMPEQVVGALCGLLERPRAHMVAWDDSMIP